MPCCAVLSRAVPCRAVPRCAAPCCAVLRCAVLRCAVLQTVLHAIAYQHHSGMLPCLLWELPQPVLQSGKAAGAERSD